VTWWYAWLLSSAKGKVATTLYTQITAEAAYSLSLLRKQVHSQVEMARILGRHPSTISRELRRSAWRCNGRGYVASRAQANTNEHRCLSSLNSAFSAAEWALDDSVLREDYGPAHVAALFARFAILLMRHETIYRHIGNDKKARGTLLVHLRRANKRIRKRYRAYDS
jgi:transposase, IS30 family